MGMACFTSIPVVKIKKQLVGKKNEVNKKKNT
jgi:hypothetical protein